MARNLLAGTIRLLRSTLVSRRLTLRQHVQSSLKRSVFDGVLWMSAGNGARALLKVAVLATLARLITPDEFGIVAGAGIAVWLSLVFSSLGVGPALIQRSTVDAAHVETAAAASTLFGIVTAAIVVAAAPAVEALLRIPGLAPILRGMALVFPLAGLASVAECMLQREFRFAAIARAELISYTLGYGIVGIGLALAGVGAWALVGAEIVKAVVKTIAMLRDVPNSRRLRLHRGALGDLLHFGTGYTAAALTTYVVAQGDNVVVARVLGVSALGVYGRAYELMLVPAQAIGMLLDKVLFPALARVQEEPERLRLAYRRATSLVALLVMPLSGAAIVLAPELVAALLGMGWTRAIVPFQILTLGMYFRVGYMIGHSVANATGAARAVAWRNALFAALVVFFAVIGARRGLVGVSIGVLVAMAVNFAMIFHLGARITGLTTASFIGMHLPAALLTAVVGLEAWGVAVAMRGREVPAVVSLIVAGLAIAPTLLLMVRMLPAALGEDGRWLTDLLCRNAPAPLAPLLRRALLRTPS
ncbi:MAG: lipopolysaccharide biosynthesis protein [Gemmatimonadaceae bacterium]